MSNENINAQQYDLIVIGGGSGGVRAARIAANLGAKVAIIESRFWGGTCVNVGCVPKKLYAYAAKFAYEKESLKGLGWDIPSAEHQWQRLRENKDAEILRLNGIYENMLTNANVDLFWGVGRFVSAQQVEVVQEQGKTLNFTANKIIIASGGTPVMPNVEGKALLSSSDELFYLDALPASVVVLGGSYIALEFACILHGLGSKVTVVHRNKTFLRGFDREAVSFLLEQLSYNGVDIRTDLQLQSITKEESAKDEAQLLAQFMGGEGDEEVFSADVVFSTIGRKPNTEALQLENAKVELGEKGEVLVDNEFCSSNPHVYAVGDVIDRVQLTPVALAEGMYLAKKFFSDEAPSVPDYQNIASAIFTTPDFASVGYTEEQVQEQE